MSKMPSSFPRTAAARGGVDDGECPAANLTRKVEVENRSPLRFTGTSTDGRGRHLQRTVRSADLLRGMRGGAISHRAMALSV